MKDIPLHLKYPLKSQWENMSSELYKDLVKEMKGYCSRTKNFADEDIIHFGICHLSKYYDPTKSRLNFKYAILKGHERKTYEQKGLNYHNKSKYQFEPLMCVNEEGEEFENPNLPLPIEEEETFAEKYYWELFTLHRIKTRYYNQQRAKGKTTPNEIWKNFKAYLANHRITKEWIKIIAKTKNPNKIHGQIMERTRVRVACYWKGKKVKNKKRESEGTRRI